MASSVLKSKTVQTVLAIAVILVLSGIGFMASVQSELIAAGVAIAGLLSLIAVVDAFKMIGGK